MSNSSLWWRKVNLLRYSLTHEECEEKPLKSPPRGSRVVVLYYTSSKIIKKTSAKCCAVLSILKGLNICFQERDVFISRKYLEELSEIFGRQVTLPRLFVGGKYVGGFHRIIELNECGKLKKMLIDYVNKSPRRVCRGCGNMRHIICFVCNGSKRFYEEEKMESCDICNENGLIPCPVCLLGEAE